MPSADPTEQSEPEPDYHSAVAVDENKLKVEDTEVYIWATVDVDTFEVIHIEVSPGDLTSTYCCSSSKS